MIDPQLDRDIENCKKRIGELESELKHEQCNLLQMMSLKFYTGVHVKWKDDCDSRHCTKQHEYYGVIVRREGSYAIIKGALGIESMINVLRLEEGEK